MGLLQVLTLVMVFIALSDGFLRRGSRDYYYRGGRGGPGGHGGYNYPNNKDYKYNQYPDYSYPSYQKYEYEPYPVSYHDVYDPYGPKPQGHGGYGPEGYGKYGGQIRGHGGYGGYRGAKWNKNALRCDPPYANIPAIIESFRNAIILAEDSDELKDKVGEVALEILRVCTNAEEEAVVGDATIAQMKECYKDVLKYFKQSKFTQISCAESFPNFHEFIEPIGYDSQITLHEVTTHLTEDVHSDNFYAYLLILFKDIDTDYDGCAGGPNPPSEESGLENKIETILRKATKVVLKTLDNDDQE